MATAKNGPGRTCGRARGRPKPRNPGRIRRKDPNELLNRDYFGQQWHYALSAQDIRAVVAMANVFWAFSFGMWCAAVAWLLMGALFWRRRRLQGSSVQEDIS